MEQVQTENNDSGMYIMFDLTPALQRVERGAYDVCSFTLYFVHEAV